MGQPADETCYKAAYEHLIENATSLRYAPPQRRVANSEDKEVKYAKEFL